VPPFGGYNKKTTVNHQKSGLALTLSAPKEGLLFVSKRYEDLLSLLFVPETVLIFILVWGYKLRTTGY
jgi:hypothetical protein